MKSAKRTLLAALFLLLGGSEVLAISDVFKQVRSSVVVLETAERALAGTRGNRALVQVGGLGSGVLVDESGLILTAAHVVQAAEKITVHFADGTSQTGTVYSSDPDADIAVVKLDEPPASGTVAKIGDSDLVEVGDQIFIVGAPMGISYTLTVGHISARRRANQLWGGFSEAEMFQTDAAINHGNSGGPMFNMKGEIIGIVSSMISSTGSYEGLGFVVTSNMAKALVLDKRSVWTGFEGYLLEGAMAHILNVPQPMGLLIQRVAADSPGSRLGFRAGKIPMTIEGEELIIGGDIILAVNGVVAKDKDSLLQIQQLVDALGPGDEIAVTILRDGQMEELKGPLTEK